MTTFLSLYHSEFVKETLAWCRLSKLPLSCWKYVYFYGTFYFSIIFNRRLFERNWKLHSVCVLVYLQRLLSSELHDNLNNWLLINYYVLVSIKFILHVFKFYLKSSKTFKYNQKLRKMYHVFETNFRLTIYCIAIQYISNNT